jgi:hypothetical protein
MKLHHLLERSGRGHEVDKSVLEKLTGFCSFCQKHGNPLDVSNLRGFQGVRMLSIPPWQRQNRGKKVALLSTFMRRLRTYSPGRTTSWSRTGPDGRSSTTWGTRRRPMIERHRMLLWVTDVYQSTLCFRNHVRKKHRWPTGYHYPVNNSQLEHGLEHLLTGFVDCHWIVRFRVSISLNCSFVWFFQLAFYIVSDFWPFFWFEQHLVRLKTKCCFEETSPSSFFSMIQYFHSEASFVLKSTTITTK